MKQNRLLSRLWCMALLCFMATAAIAQPSNDNCGGTINVACGGTYTGTLIGATGSTPSHGLPDVWYRLANASGPVTVSLCSSSPTTWDSYLWVYRLDAGQPECGTASIVGYDDDGCGSNYLSTYTFTASPTAVYYILVADYGSTSLPSTFTLTVACTPSTAAPSNDFCGNAIPVACGTSVSGSTTYATADPGFTSKGIWYTVAGTGYPVSVSTCGASYASAINVFTGNCGSQTGVLTSSVACTNGTTTTFNTAVGTTYYILVNSSTNTSGNFSLTVQCPTPTPPANDYCSGAISVSCTNTYNGTTIGATPESLGGSPSVWYTLVGNGQLNTASLCGNNAFDSHIRVLKLAPGGDCKSGPFYGAGSNDDFCAQDAQVSWWADLGATYYIVVSGATPNDFGDFKLTISCDADGVPDNDLCANAIPVVCGGDYSGSTVGATIDSPPGTTGVWYLLTATATGSYTISLCGGASWDTYLYATKELLCDAQNSWDFNDDYCSVQSQLLPYSLTTGDKLYILVGGYRGATGFFTLKITGPCIDNKMAAITNDAPKPSELAVQIAPNPASDFTEFALSVEQGGMAELRIMDLAGHEIAQKSLGELQAGTHQYRHEWNGAPAGIYLYQVTVGKQQVNGKLQVLR